MKNLLQKTFPLTILFLLFPLVSFAQVSKIVFFTEEQNIKPNSASSVITIQLQDSAGGLKSLGETSDLFLESSSATGQFSASSTSWENTNKLTVNSNWTNRSFYYRDSTDGSFVISVSLKRRSTGEEFKVTQNIIISKDGSIPSAEVLGANTDAPGSSQSATSGSVEPKYSTPSTKLEVAIGGDRLTSPGSPISFQAEIKKNSVANSAVEFSWSFGDGNVEEGALVSHMYRYPGDYAVVLNATAGNIFAIARLKVKVVDPSISVRQSSPEEGDFIEISNSSSYEINLFNWKIVNGNKGFVFQPDTIILAKSKIRLDGSLLKMKGEPEEGLVLKNYLGQVVATVPKKLQATDLKEISAQVEEARRQAYAVVEKAIYLGMATEEEPFPPSMAVAGPSADNTAEQTVKEEPSDGLKENLIYEASKQEGVLARAWHFLVGVLR